MGRELGPPEPMGLSVAETLRQTHACSSVKMGNMNYGEQGGGEQHLPIHLRHKLASH